MNPFVHLDEDGLLDYFDACRSISHDDGDLVCDDASASENIYIVRSGTVRVSILSHNGGERLLFYGRSGCLLGDTLCFSEQAEVPVGLQVIAMGPCEVVTLSHQRFRAICATDVRVAAAVISRAYSKVARLIEQLEYATFRDTTVQLAALVQALANEAAGAGPGNQPVRVKMTHQMMAAATGRTRVSVTYGLNRLQEEGAIRLGRGYVEVIDAARLQRHVDYDEPRSGAAWKPSPVPGSHAVGAS